MVSGALCIIIGFCLCAICMTICAESIADAIVESVNRKWNDWPEADALNDEEESML